MRPALQRLLERPSGLQLLQTLIAPLNTLTPIRLHSRPCYRCGGSTLTGRNARRWLSLPAQALQENDVQDPCERSGNAPVQRDAVKNENEETNVFKAPGTSNALALEISNGFSTVERIEFESDVTDTSSTELRLVDDPRFNHDFELWLRILEFRQRRQGEEGVLDVWKGIQQRNICLPTVGERADELWTTFLELGFARSAVLEEICLYAFRLHRDTRLRWPKLYETVIGHFLCTRPGDAYQWHRRLRVHHPPRPEHFKDLVCLGLGDTQSRGVLRRLYKDIGQSDIYTTIIPLLCQQGLYSEALRWHIFLLGHKDIPPDTRSVKPLIQHLKLFQNPEPLKRAFESLEKAGLSFEKPALEEPREDSVLSREKMNLILGETYHIRPKEFSDEFGARLFATKAFSVDVILSGMGALGVGAIGPLSMKELAMREEDPKAIVQRLTQLDEAGISIGTSVFSQCVKNAAISNDAQLLYDIITSDQHPDVLEDTPFQESLLTFYHKNSDWRKFNRTLAILTVHDPDSGPTHVWNSLLRTYLQTSNFPTAQRTFGEMRRRGVYIEPETLKAVSRVILRNRAKHKRPDTWFRGPNANGETANDDLGQLTRFWLGALQEGYKLPPSYWTEIIRRYGMTGRLHELEKLIWHLVTWYSPRQSSSRVSRTARMEASDLSSIFLPDPTTTTSTTTTTTTTTTPTTGIPNTLIIPSVPSAQSALPADLPIIPESHHYYNEADFSALNTIFSPSFQRALVAWSFKSISDLSPSASRARQQGITADPIPPYARGLHLLAQLRRHGVHVHTSLVRKVVRARLVTLFGTARVSDKRENRVAASKNPWGLEEMVRVLDGVWGGGLFSDDAGAGEAVDDETARVRRKRQAARKRKKAKELADGDAVAAVPKALSSSLSSLSSDSSPESSSSSSS
ncbi:MAG: hypothetical protein M1819_006697 [Sarea resinae]|nr:MAG: hypothetical protein M1819_006697 [Sarea resinae]